MCHQIRLLFITAVFILALAACGAASPVSNAQPSQPVEMASANERSSSAEELATTVVITATDDALTSSEVLIKDVYAIGDVARVNDFLVRVDNVEITNQTTNGTSQFGNQFVLVTISVENISSEPLTGAPSFSMVVEAAGGQIYPLDGKASIDDLSAEGLMEPGAVEMATVGYQVPETVQGLRWVFSAASQDSAELNKSVFAIQR